MASVDDAVLKAMARKALLALRVKSPSPTELEIVDVLMRLGVEYGLGIDQLTEFQGAYRMRCWGFPAIRHCMPVLVA